MSTGVKILLWIVVILIIATVIGFTWGKKAWDKISFSKPDLQGLDLQGLTINDFLNSAFVGTERNISATLGMTIKNENNFSIPFGNMKIQLLYNNIIVAETSNMLSMQKFIIPAKGNLAISDTINVQLSKAGTFLIEKIKGNHPQMDYKINLSVFGIPIPAIKNNFTW